MKMFNVKIGGANVLYIQLEKENIEETVEIPDTGLCLDFNSDGELIGIESIQRDKDFSDEWLEEAGLK